MWMCALFHCEARVTQSDDDRSAAYRHRSSSKDTTTFVSFLTGRVVCLGVIAWWMLGPIVPTVGQELDIEQEKIIQSERSDRRHLSTRGFIQHLLRSADPKLAFDPEFTPEELEGWRLRVRARLEQLMNFPEVPPQPAPEELWTKERDGYRLEKWEVYPEPGSVVPYSGADSGQVPRPNILLRR